jgi:hypothetical protein
LLDFREKCEKWTQNSPQGIVQQSVPLCAGFFLIIATGVRPLIVIALGVYLSSFLRVKTSVFDDAFILSKKSIKDSFYGGK